MRYNIHIGAILLGFVMLLFSCTDENTAGMGSQIQPSQDGIVVKADTFHLRSSNYFPEYIYSSADSFLLGNYYDATVGDTHASILAQVACPLVESSKDSKSIFPENTEVDSIELQLYYRSYFGSGNAPIELSVYEMNKGTFKFNESYPTNLDLTDYCDESIKLGNRMLIANDPKDSIGSGSSKTSVIRIKLSKDFADRFFDIESDTYHSFDKFNEFFNGLYVTANYGSDVMFHIIQMNLSLSYHFSYQLEGQDSIEVGTRMYPANSEVRQINRFEHPDKRVVEEELKKNDSINYISSPANIYTRVTLPIARICDSISTKINNKATYINSAALTIDISEVDFEKAALPTTDMLLIKESAIDRFFKKKESLNDTCAVVATIAETEIDATTSEYYYSFDISSIIQEKLGEQEKLGKLNEDELNMLLVPVKLIQEASSTQTVVSGVKPEYLMTTTLIKSAQSKSNPMKLNLVYSGF